MKRNGFTLIELLAVIVILAIIALIATPIILGIINDAREKANERSVELYASAVKNAVAAYQLIHPNAPKSFSDLTIDYDGTVECTVAELYEDGSFYLEGCKVNGTEKEYSYGEKQSETPVAKVCSIEKQDSTKYSVGDVVTCNIGETQDKFYVIEAAEKTASTIQLLTEKNIHTTEYRQSDNAGTVAFSTTYYWSSATHPVDVYDENSLLYPIVEEYVSYLNTKLTNITGSLLTYSQAKNLGCDDSSKYTCGPDVFFGELENPAPSWVYSTGYWLGSAGDSGHVWAVGWEGDFGRDYSGYDYNSYGVRPVITISTGDIQ